MKTILLSLQRIKTTKPQKKMAKAKAKKVKIAIYMNGEEIRYRIVLEKDLQSEFVDMHDMAGGLWNGKDEFTVKIIEL